MGPDEVIVHGRHFVRILSEETIASRVDAMATSLTDEFREGDPLFLVVLRGAFMFAADLVRSLPFDPEVEFIRISSYEGLQSTGNVNIGDLPGSTVLQGRNVVIVEDIVESGNTLTHLKEKLIAAGVSGVTVVTLFYKPASLETSLSIDLAGFEIPDDFIIGYGLDFNGRGRGLKSVYALTSGQ